MENKSVKIGYLIKPAVFVLFALILEMVNFLWLGFKVTGHTNWAQVFPTYIILDLCVFFLIAGIIFLLKRVWANVFYYFFLGFQLLLNMVNATLYKVFGDLFSWDMLNLGGEAAASFKFEFIDFWSIAVNLLILGVIIFVQIVLDRKIKKEVFHILKIRFSTFWVYNIKRITQTIT